MKIQIKEKDETSGFKKGQLLSSYKGGIYLCTKDQIGQAVDVVVIKPEGVFETEGHPLKDCDIEDFVLFTGEITLSND
jgi:hypothetical protein